MSLNRVISAIEYAEPTFYVTYEEEEKQYTIRIDSYKEFRKIVGEIIRDDKKRLIQYEANKNLKDYYIWY